MAIKLVSGDLSGIFFGVTAESFYGNETEYIGS